MLVDVPIVLIQSQRAKSYLKLCSLNARSVKNKSADFVDYVGKTGADLFAITETWFTENDVAAKVEATPSGFNLLDHPRKGCQGGGTALLFRENLCARKVAAGELRSFEYLDWTVEYRLSSSIGRPIQL